MSIVEFYKICVYQNCHFIAAILCLKGIADSATYFMNVDILLKSGSHYVGSWRAVLTNLSL